MTVNSIQPTFIIVGAARSGTTSSYHWLKAHPQVFMPPVKETNYWSNLDPKPRGPGDMDTLGRPLERKPDGTFAERGAAIVSSWNDYLELFAGSEEFAARGEASPSYMYYPEAATRIGSALPTCKIVILLRDPVERAFSHYKAFRMAGREELDFASALQLEDKRLKDGWEWAWAFRSIGLYYTQVKRYLDLFRREAVGIWLYEDMRSAPVNFYSEICHFIGVADNYVPEFTRHNRSRSKTGPLTRYSMRHLGIRRAATRLIPAPAKPFLRSLEDNILSKPLTLTASTRRYLLEYYRKDILALQKLLPELNVVRWIETEEEELKNAE